MAHFGWQIYGNFIYFEWRGKNDESDEEFLKCMDEKNNQEIVNVMLLFLIIGYFFFMIYIFVFLMVVFMVVQRRRSRDVRINNSNLVLNQISRVPFSESLFGALGKENECIICMTPYTTSDTITKLSCNDRHFFHTGCIEQWIRQGSNNCPMCRQPIA